MLRFSPAAAPAALAVIATSLVAAPAAADIVQVDINGTVEFNQINFGVFGDVTTGDSATYSFQVDSDLFVDGSFPTRGYEILPGSMNVTIGSGMAGLADPYPAGQTPFFVLRDNDPAVDGFFLGGNPDGFPSGVLLDEEGLVDTLSANFNVTYGNDPLPSLNILDAAGTYDFDGLTVFGMSINDGPFEAMFMVFDSMTITVVPTPAAAPLLMLAGLAAGRRRRG
jgi:hypothetical protein